MAKPVPATNLELPAISESRVLQRRQKEGAAKIIEITSRFYRQIRSGCGNPACPTQTCLSFEQKQANGTPYRKPTILSARAMAACLAASPNPTTKLCPYGQLQATDLLDQAFPDLGARADLPRESAAASENGTVPDDLDKKSLIQLLFNTNSWKSAQTSHRVETPPKIAEAITALRLQLKVAPEMQDPTLICLGLDALYDSLLRFQPAYVDNATKLQTWNSWVELRQSGRYLLDPSRSGSSKNRGLAISCRDFADRYQDENVLRLLRHIVLVFHKCASEEGEKNEKSNAECKIVEFLAPEPATIRPIVQGDPLLPVWGQEPRDRVVPTAHVALEWCRALLQHEWDNTATFSRSSIFGCTIQFMGLLYRHRIRLELDKKLFQTPYLFKRMDFMEVSRSWHEDALPQNSSHLLSYPWLFPVSGLVTYFRVLNHLSMSRAFNDSMSLQYLITRHKILVDSHERQIFDRLKTAMGQLLVLEIKRHKILEDAMNELWRRQRRELRRPLKVRMGMDEGEEGVDFGGVQQEFFRLSLGEALDQDYGLFTTDDTTRMTWFLPCSKAPLHHFVLVGILVGLAVYNGITLSVTFPEALYRKILGEPVETLEHIQDGWPTLTKGLRYLLDYEDGDVGDILMRSYVFSAAANGTTVSADMQAVERGSPWPGPLGLEPSEVVEASAPLVTNGNREKYVSDYIFWLTDKSIRPQYEAFAKGFFLCVEKASVRLFDAPSLRNLVEGYQRVEIDALERTASYDNGYYPEHEVIEYFWHVVRSFSVFEVRKLLEFVTASDRVPAKGIEEIVFIIQRNGRDDERLPTSQTCFGRLLLPEYSSREILEAKLRQAMVHSLGFYLQ